MKPPILLLLSLCAVSLSAAPVLAGDNLISNGDFEEGPAGWPTGEGISYEQEGGNTFLRLSSPEAGKQVQAYRKIALGGGDKNMTLKFRARWKEIVPGVESWHRGSMILHFRDDGGAMLKPDPKPKTFKDTSEDWQEFTMEFEVPENAAALEIMPALFQVESGTLDVDDLVLSTGS